MDNPIADETKEPDYSKTRKKLARDRLAFENRAPTPTPERKITQKVEKPEKPKTEDSSPFFFADTD